MAGDWIPMRLDLADDPAVIAIAGATGLDEFAVVGRLHRLWSWANRHLSSGDAPGVTEPWIDRYVSAPGFAAAMLAAGWLRTRSGGVEFPAFEHWNSKSAKQRVLTARRMAKSRDAKSDAPRVTKTSPEKRTEQKRTEEEPSPNPSRKAGGEGAVERAAPVVIPPELDTDAFRAAWGEWKADRSARRVKPYTALGEGQQLKHLATFGPAVAVEAIRVAIRNQWQGLFPQRVKASGSDLARPPAETTQQRVARIAAERASRHGG